MSKLNSSGPKPKLGDFASIANTCDDLPSILDAPNTTDTILGEVCGSQDDC